MAISAIVPQQRIHIYKLIPLPYMIYAPQCLKHLCIWQCNFATVTKPETWNLKRV